MKPRFRIYFGSIISRLAKNPMQPFPKRNDEYWLGTRQFQFGVFIIPLE